MEKLVSIIVPVYKVEEYIARCVESILAQTYQNMQIILVDDGSPDNSVQICQEYAKDDNRIEIVRQENQGVSVARNNGIDHAAGEYICFVDSDDYIMPNYVSRLVESIESDGGGRLRVLRILSGI